MNNIALRDELIVSVPTNFGEDYRSVFPSLFIATDRSTLGNFTGVGAGVHRVIIIMMIVHLIHSDMSVYYSCY